ncbi:hypothetical protein [Cochleicola gelatinilyticus]|uniref:Uncharacterized protein n=1 Tax=Cochleicola gelatinilyticus TaxID=1763537 RepID=A0A167EX91_9FLAO|nr:hypothetical protein [Cochleicola gelatinilyticus]OAB75965.1 hypothetical protein ULVI_12930 [Cochleicola gelatinilyticus]
MKKVFLSLALVAAISVSFTSCRETKEDKVEINVDDADDVADDVEDAIDDAGDAIEEGVDEIQENTGTGGTDDN